MKERSLVGLAVFVALIKDNKVFLIRRANTGYGDGMYALPAGHAEKEEKATIAASRECQEEAGVVVDPADLKFFYTLHIRRKNHPVYIDLFFKTKQWQGEPYAAEKNKSDDGQWFALDSLPENTLPYVKEALANLETNIYFAETWF